MFADQQDMSIAVTVLVVSLLAVLFAVVSGGSRVRSRIATGFVAIVWFSVGVFIFLTPKLDIDPLEMSETAESETSAFQLDSDTEGRVFFAGPNYYVH